MAITVLRQVNGDGTGTGTGAAVTWASIGTGNNPSLSNAGLYYTGAEGAGDLNLTTASQRGVFYPWDYNSDGDSQPAWATGGGYIEFNNASSPFEAIAQSICTAITNQQCTDGLEFSFGLQFALDGTFTAGSNPVNNDQCYFSRYGNNDGDTAFWFTMLSRNVAGFKAGVMFDFWSTPTGAKTALYPTMGGALTQPGACLELNRWYLYRIRYKHSTTASSNDGRLEVFIDDMPVARITGIDCTIPSSKAYLYRLFSPLTKVQGQGYETLTTGIKLRYCPPITARVVPDADLTFTPDWRDSVTRNQCVRRAFPTIFSDALSLWTKTGAGTLSEGGLYASNGNTTGRQKFSITGAVTLTTKHDLWDGSAATTIFDATTGWTHLNFREAYPNGTTVTYVLYQSDNTTPVFTIVLNDSAHTLSINGTTVFTGLGSTKRWQLLVSLRGTQGVCWLHDLTSDTKAAGGLQCVAFTAAYTTGSALGKASVAFANGSSSTFGGLMALSKLWICETDSYASSAENAVTPHLHMLANRLGTGLLQCSDNECIPNHWDPVPPSGGLSNLTVAICAARSGGKLSESETYYWPAIAQGLDVNWLLLCGTVNDITAVTTEASAVSLAKGIAQRIGRLASLAISQQGTLTVVGAINVVDGSGGGAPFDGASAAYQRKVPLMVDTILPGVLWTLGPSANGRIRHIPLASSLLDTVAYIDPVDGIHPNDGLSPISSHRLLLFAHAYATTLTGNMPGYNGSGYLDIPLNEGPIQTTPMRLSLLGT